MMTVWKSSLAPSSFPSLRSSSNMTPDVLPFERQNPTLFLFPQFLKKKDQQKLFAGFHEIDKSPKRDTSWTWRDQFNTQLKPFRCVGLCRYWGTRSNGSFILPCAWTHIVQRIFPIRKKTLALRLCGGERSLQTRHVIYIKWETL